MSLYYTHGNGKRYRSLGCAPCTQAVESDSRRVRDIIAERSGRAQDKEGGGGLESLRRDGYM